MSNSPTYRIVRLDQAEIHAQEAGPGEAPTIVLLHGFPQDSSAWSQVMALAADDGFHVLAPDLPGIGASSIAAPNGNKDQLAGLIRQFIRSLSPSEVTLVGHDAGGMVAYAYLRAFGDICSAVVMDTVVPGIDPWQQVLANPYVWHFGFHQVPGLPEALVTGRAREYFDYFFDAISADPSRVTDDARARYAQAYSSPESLRQGFELYRSFPADARANAEHRESITTPLLYLRGDGEGGDIADYAAGFRAAGIRNLQTGIIPSSGHFTPEENPAAVWTAIRDFVGRR